MKPRSSEAPKAEASAGPVLAVLAKHVVIGSVVLICGRFNLPFRIGRDTPQISASVPLDLSASKTLEQPPKLLFWRCHLARERIKFFASFSERKKVFFADSDNKGYHEQIPKNADSPLSVGK